MIKVTDLFATIAYLGGVSEASWSELDGDNIWPSLKESENLGERSLYLRTNKLLSYRNGDWKLIHHAATLDSANNELFNIKNDPTEINNLIEENPEVYRSLWNELKLQVSLEDDLLENRKHLEDEINEELLNNGL